MRRESKMNVVTKEDLESLSASLNTSICFRWQDGIRKLSTRLNLYKYGIK